MDSWFKEHIDFVTLFIVLALTGIGIMSVYSATYDAGASAFFNRQLIWGGIGLLLMISIALMQFRTLQLLSLPMYGVSLLFLVAVLVAGKTVAGTKSWFGVRLVIMVGYVTVRPGSGG